MGERVLVLGAGIQGVCAALMLAQRGFQVELIDKCDEILTRASLNYEGRIHLGFVYSLDRSEQTGKRLINDALNFAPILERLIGQKIDWQAYRSHHTNYFVANDTLRPASEIEAYYERLNEYYLECTEDQSLNYLGLRPERIFKRIDIPQYFNNTLVTDCFKV